MEQRIFKKINSKISQNESHRIHCPKLKPRDSRGVSSNKDRGCPRDHHTQSIHERFMINHMIWSISYGPYHMTHLNFPLGNPPEAKRNKICLLFYSIFSRPTLSSCWFLLFHHLGKRTTGHQNSALNDSTTPTQERLPAIGLVQVTLRIFLSLINYITYNDSYTNIIQTMAEYDNLLVFGIRSLDKT